MKKKAMWNFEFFTMMLDHVRRSSWEIIFELKKNLSEKNMKTEPRVELPIKKFMFICIIDYKLY